MHLGGMGKINKMDDKKIDYIEILTPEFIKTNRIRLGMSQSELAKLVNVDKTSIIHWEKGRIYLKSKYLETLYNILTDPAPYQKLKKDKPAILTPEFIKSNRERLGMTKKELAKACDVSLMTIFRWESGEQYPQVWHRKPLLDILSSSDPSLENDIQRKSDDLSSILTPEFIKSNRVRRNMRQKDLAELINVSENTICSWESGLHKPQLFHHEKLMDILSDPSPYFNKSSILTPDFIKSNRIRQGMTQSNLAKLINVTTMMISCWENGVHKVSSKIAPLLYDALVNPNTYPREKKQK